MSDAPSRLDAARARRDNVVALIDGKVVDQLPADLYIPPDALEVFLEAFEGPLDLLLYLIRRQNLDILDIEVAEVTEQYLHYIDLMKALKLDLAGEYLLMAAMLAEIKSRLLLPQPATDDEEEDPRSRTRAAPTGIRADQARGREPSTNCPAKTATCLAPTPASRSWSSIACSRRSTSRNSWWPWPRCCAVPTSIKSTPYNSKACRSASACPTSSAGSTPPPGSLPSTPCSIRAKVVAGSW